MRDEIDAVVDAIEAFVGSVVGVDGKPWADKTPEERIADRKILRAALVLLIDGTSS